MRELFAIVFFIAIILFFANMVVSLTVLSLKDPAYKGWVQQENCLMIKAEYLTQYGKDICAK